MSGSKKPASRPSRTPQPRPQPTRKPQTEPTPGPSTQSARRVSTSELLDDPPSDIEQPPGGPSVSPEESTSSPYRMTDARLIARNRRSKRKCGRCITQTYASFLGKIKAFQNYIYYSFGINLACLSALSFGMVIGWSAPITYNLFEAQETEQETSVRFGLLASMMPLGCAVGVIYWTYLMHRWGPRRALQVQGPIYVANWWLSTLFVGTDISLASRFFMGTTSIAHIICGEAFLKETVHPSVFKYVRFLISVVVCVGVLGVYVIGRLTSDNIKLLGFCSSIPILHWLLLWFIPESPVFLFRKGAKAAEKSLIWYRGKENIYLDLRQITRDYESYRVDPDSYRYMLYSKVVAKATLRIIIIELLRASSGYHIFLFYSPRLWNYHNILLDSIHDGMIMASFFAVSKIVCAFIFIFSPNIRVSLLLSVFLTATHMSLLSCYMFVVSNQIWEGQDWVVFALVSGVILSSDLSLNTCSGFLIAQYIPHQVFIKVRSISYVFFWIFVFVNVFGFYIVYKYYSVYYWFGGIAIFEYLGLIYLYFFLINPKGKSLIQIQIELGGNPIGSRSLYGAS